MLRNNPARICDVGRFTPEPEHPGCGIYIPWPPLAVRILVESAGAPANPAMVETLKGARFDRGTTALRAHTLCRGRIEGDSWCLCPCTMRSFPEHRVNLWL